MQHVPSTKSVQQVGPMSDSILCSNLDTHLRRALVCVCVLQRRDCRRPLNVTGAYWCRSQSLTTSYSLFCVSRTAYLRMDRICAMRASIRVSRHYRDAHLVGICVRQLNVMDQLQRDGQVAVPDDRYKASMSVALQTAYHDLLTLWCQCEFSCLPCKDLSIPVPVQAH